VGLVQRIYDQEIFFQGGLVRLAAWHLPSEPLDPPAKWAATSNVEGGSWTGLSLGK